MVSLDADSQNRLLALLLQYRGEMTIIIASYFDEIAQLSDFCIDISQHGHATLVNKPGAN